MLTGQSKLRPVNEKTALRRFVRRYFELELSVPGNSFGTEAATEFQSSLAASRRVFKRNPVPKLLPVGLCQWRIVVPARIGSMLMLSSRCRGRAERGNLTHGPACDAHHSLPGLATLGHLQVERNGEPTTASSIKTARQSGPQVGTEAGAEWRGVSQERVRGSCRKQPR